MTTLVGAVGLVLGVAVLWATGRGRRWASPLGALLTVLELITLALSLVQLGWLGLWLLLGAHIVALVGWSVAGALFVDQQVARAAAWSGTEKDEVRRIIKMLDQDDQLTLLGPRDRARLVSALTERARTLPEAEQMAPVVGLVWTLCDRPDIEWLAERFDSLLRVYDKPAAEAMEVADVITVSAQRSAATMWETIEALVVAGGGAPGAGAPTPGG